MTWGTVRLGEHVELVTGFPFKSAEFEDEQEGSFRLLRGDNVAQGKLRWDGVRYWPGHKADPFSKLELVKGDVVLAMDRPWISAGLKWAVVLKSDLPALLVQRVARLRAKAPLDQRFLAYVIGSPNFTKHVQSITTGVNVPHISGRNIKAFEFRLPSLAEQRRIASILCAYDDLIEVNRRRVAILEETARRLFEEWFVHLRFPGHETVPVHDTPDGPLPEGWRRVPLRDLIVVTRGSSYRSADLVEAGALPFVTLKNLHRNGGYRASGTKRYAGSFRQHQTVVPGDMVVAVTDMTQERKIVGRVARIPRLDHPFAVISMDLIKVVPRPRVDPLYLYSFLLYSPIGAAAAELANGVNVLHLSPMAMLGLEGLAPSEEIQNRFGLFVSELHTMAENLLEANERLAVARDLLLPRLISGELSVANAPAPERFLEAAD